MGFLGSLTYSKTEDMIEEIRKINKRLDKIEKKLKEQEEQSKTTPKEWLDGFNNIFKQATSEIPDPCRNCSNHPSNGGPGICHCTVPYISHTTVDGINSNIYNT